MTSLYPVTEDLRLENQGVFQNDADEDGSDLSSEEDFSPEPEDSVQGPVDGFAERGPHDAQSACAPGKKDKKDKNKETKDKSVPKDAKSRGKTDQKPRKPNPANYK